jgi:hypothetical protein
LLSFASWDSSSLIEYPDEFGYMRVFRSGSKQARTGALINNFVAGAVALQGFASSPEHIATHAPL